MAASIFTFQGVLDNFKSKIWSFHIKIPPHIVRYYHSAKINRLTCSLNHGDIFPTAMIPAGEGVYFINVNKQRRKTLGLQEGDEVSVQLMPDDSRYGMPMPEEMREVMEQDPLGDQLFHALTPGKQRSLLFIIAKIKNKDKRIEKAMIIIEHLKETGGTLEYELLSQAFKSKL